MNYVNVISPRNLPDLRLALMDEWRPGGVFHRIALLAAATRMTGVEMPLQPEGAFLTLRDAVLYYVKADMVALVQHAANTLPPTTLTEELLPSPYGFAVFEAPLEGVDSMTGDPVHIWAVSWCRARIDARLEGTVLQFYGRIDRAELERLSYLYPCGNTDWPYNTDTDVIVDPDSATDAIRLNSMSEDRRWFAALWLLAGQPLTETRSQPADRATARRSSRAKVSSEVRLVDLRPRSTPSSGDTESRKVDWSHRWIVGGETGGFWRQQAYGPNHSLRKPIWIHEYVKGPEDKPLKVKDTVRIVRGEGTGPTARG